MSITLNFLSSFSDDLLNYELGDDLDDQDLVENEDDLLLSDEGLSGTTSVREITLLGP